MKYPWKQAILTGVIVGLFAIFAFTFADALNKKFAWGVNPSTIRGLTGLLTPIILGTGIYTGMQNIKRHNNGILTYKQAVAAGIFIAIITAVIVAILGLIYVIIVNPRYSDYMVAEGEKAMIAEGKSPEQVAAGTADLQKQFSVPMQLLQALVGQSASGTLISVVMALFIRTKKTKNQK